MKIIGSRAKDSDFAVDEFSDWDHRVEAQDDFQEMERFFEESVVCLIYRQEKFWLMTLIDSHGIMHDFSDASEKFNGKWEKFYDSRPYSRIDDYWLMSFKHLKGIFRGDHLLVDLGIEMSSGLVRDHFIENHFKVADWKSFTSFKALKPRLKSEIAEMRSATTMAYKSAGEKLAKIAALNHIMSQIEPERSRQPSRVFEIRRALVPNDG